MRERATTLFIQIPVAHSLSNSPCSGLRPAAPSPNLVLAYTGTIVEVSHLLLVNIVVGGFGGAPPAFEYPVKVEEDNDYRRRVSAVREEVAREVRERIVGVE